MLFVESHCFVAWIGQDGDSQDDWKMFGDNAAIALSRLFEVTDDQRCRNPQ